MKTPKLYNAMSVDDFKEPMEYVFNKLKPKRAYAVGCSMGSMVLSNYLGVYPDQTLISGAVCVQAAIKKWKGVEHFTSSGFGIYNYFMGKY